MPRRPDAERRNPSGPARVAASLAAIGALAIPLLIAAPADAVGEDGPFDLPMTSHTIAVIPGGTTRTDVAALIQDSAEPDLDLTSVRLSVPPEASADTRKRMKISGDGSRLTVQGQGVWTVSSGTLTFVPDAGFHDAPKGVALTVGSRFDTRSRPGLLSTTAPTPVDRSVSASEGEEVTVDLAEKDPAARPGRQSLVLDGLPAGSSVTDDGDRLIVPDEGTWQLEKDGTSVTFHPVGKRLAARPAPIRYIVHDGSGVSTSSGRVTVQTPVIQDLRRSAPFGEQIDFEVSESARDVDPETLELVPVDGASSAEKDGTRVQVEGQGTWVLDRSASRVTFSPADGAVHRVTPMGLRGGDGKGSKSAVALLDTVYPGMLDRYEAARPGSEITFIPLAAASASYIRADSLAFAPDAQFPGGTRVSDDGARVDVPGQGTWTLDHDARSITFSPSEELEGDPRAMPVQGSGLFSDATTTATMHARYTQNVPVLRDDVLRGPPGRSMSVDLLANDTPGGSSTPIDPGSIRLESLLAANVSELQDGDGSRVVIPEEGEYRVEPDGVLTFTPAAGFVGRGTPITYTAQDRAGTRMTATVVADVDPTAHDQGSAQEGTSGITTLLAGIMPSSVSTFAVFGTVVTLLVFTGVAATWIGARMQRDREE